MKNYTLELEFLITGVGILDNRYYICRKALGKYTAPLGFEVKTNLNGENLENNQILIKTSVHQENGRVFEEIISEIELFLIEELKKDKEGLRHRSVEIEKKSFRTGEPGTNSKLEAYEEIDSTRLKLRLSKLIRYKNNFNYMDIIPSSSEKLNLDDSVNSVNEFWDYKRAKMIKEKNK